MKFTLGLDEISLIANRLCDEKIVLLCGDLASGKTTLVKAVARKFGKEKLVSSPTFSIMQDYGEFYHYDIYNCGFDGILKNGLIENFFEDGYHIVEWADENLEIWLRRNGLSYTKVRIGVEIDRRIYEVEKCIN